MEKKTGSENDSTNTQPNVRYTQPTRKHIRIVKSMNVVTAQIFSHIM